MDYAFSWYWIWKYREAFLKGLWTTLELNFYVIVLATIVGLFLALARLSRAKPLRVIAWIYIDLFRTLPLLVLIFWLYFAFPLLTGRRIIFGSFIAACIALTLNLSAFIAEIMRAGILAVPEQHIEAARSLGLTKSQTLRHVTLPIAVRLMLPPLTGQYINAIKLSVLASVIAVPELLHTVQTITTEVFRPIEMYSTLAFIFLLILLPGTWLLSKLESSLHNSKIEFAGIHAEQLPPMNLCQLNPLLVARYEEDKLEQNEILVVQGVYQAFNGFQVLQNVSFTASPGRIVSIIGPNGSGKTTLLRTICGFLTLQDGEIRLGNHLLAVGNSRNSHRPIYSTSNNLLARKIGMVGQQVDPWPHLSALENVMLPLVKARRMEEGQARDLAIQWLTAVGLQKKIKRYGRELSGGLKQRVILARTLALGPKVLLFDEVTSALDPEWSAWVRELMQELRRRGTIILNVSHKMHLVREVSSWIIFLDRGELVEQGPPDEILTDPKSSQLRLFLSCS